MISGHQHGRAVRTPRDAPNRVDRPALGIALENQNARAFGVIRIVLHDKGFGDALDDLRRQNAVRRQLIVAVSRDSNLAPGSKPLYPA